jgi:hypothetical protein
MIGPTPSTGDVGRVGSEYRPIGILSPTPGKLPALLVRSRREDFPLAGVENLLMAVLVN